VAPPPAVAGPLTRRDREILDFELGWWLLPVAKAPAIRDRLGISPSRYYELLSALIDLPAAERYDPLLVRRLRRARAVRRRAHVEGRTGRRPGR
jgi:hypothetical protein